MPDISSIKINGPFWTAEADLFQLNDPEQHWSLQSLFLSRTPQTTFGVEKVLRPNMMLALCAVQSVTVNFSTEVSYTWSRSNPAPQLSDLSQAEIEEAIRETGELSLLLLHTDSQAWPAEEEQNLPEFTCVTGEISLDVNVMTAESEAVADLYGALSVTQPVNSLDDREGAARPIGKITAHSSGLSLLGSVHLPWSKEERSAIFQLARLMPNQNPDPAFRLSIELDRLTKDEDKNFRADWSLLNTFLSPQLQNKEDPAPPLAKSTPVWITLELADPTDLPRLYWELDRWGGDPHLFLEPDALNLILSDQHPDDEDTPAASLSRVAPGLVSLTKISDGTGTSLHLAVEAGSQASKTDKNKLTFSAEQPADDPQSWTTSVEATNLIVAFDAVQTPRLLRNIYEIDEPNWLPDENPTPIDPSLVWGFMPLNNGWAQLPIPNLSEQVYLDAGVANIKAFEKAAQDSEFLLGGAVSFGNDRPEILETYVEEQPWSVTAIDAEYLQGTWTLKNLASGDYELAEISLEIHEADVTLNGIFWLATGQPSAEDAIPELADWTSSLRSIPLRTVKLNQLFPPAVTLAFEQLEFSLRRTDLSELNSATTEPGNDQTSQLAASAQLDDFAFLYQANEKILGALIEEGILPADTFGRHTPIIWMRHPTLPMIQALPLTQTKTPPNYPSQSRQLVPFAMGITTFAHPTKDEDGADISIPVSIPDTWRFGAALVQHAAQEWAKALSTVAPVSEWQVLYDLPLVALSLPGLVLGPNDPNDPDLTSGLDRDEALGLTLQYRFDLPYTDELNALAQLPKVKQSSDLSTPLAEAPPPETAKPLTRETFVEHWQQLAEEAGLAALDAVAAFFKHNGEIVLRHLVEPLNWQVKPAVDLTDYPGKLTIENDAAAGSSSDLTFVQNGSAKITLEDTDSLRGIHGSFEVANKSGTGASQLTITAGSMTSAFEETASEKWLRDQRGLLRAASKKDRDFIKTPLKFDKDRNNSSEHELWSLLSTCQLEIPGNSGNTNWQFWFRDLPLQNNEFLRKDIVSEFAQDVNDPEAVSREHNFLTGYEWRLGESSQIGDNYALPLYGLDFYPLTLEQLIVDETSIQTVEIVGRLQLPLQIGDGDEAEDQEQEDFNNVVRLTFTGTTNLELQLKGISVEPNSDIGNTWIEWPLGLNAKGEPTDAPLLRWKNIQLNESPPGLIIDEAQLKFFLFDVEWTVDLNQEISFPSPDELSVQLPRPDQMVALYPAQLQIDFQGNASSQFDPQLSLTLNVNLGDDGEDQPTDSATETAAAANLPESTKQRVADGIQALYTFTEGGGAKVFDVSNVDQPLDLELRALGSFNWTDSGLNIPTPSILISNAPATKLTETIKNALVSNVSDAGFTIELWITPAQAQQNGPATIFSLVNMSNTLEVSLGQGLWGTQPTDLYSLRVRNAENEPLIWANIFEHFYDVPTHLVYVQTKDTASFYLRPLSTEPDAKPALVELISASLAGWQADEFRLVLANAITGDKPWLGTIHSVAVYDRVLAQEEIDQNFDVGIEIPPPPGRAPFTAEVKYYLWGSPTKDVEWLSGYLFDDLQIRDENPSSPVTKSGKIVSSSSSLQFQWQQYSAERTGLQLLPGMSLDEQLAEAPGYAALTFEAAPSEGLPDLRLKTAFVEVLLLARWGKFLQDVNAPASVEKDLVCSSSAGKLTFGYTSHWNFRQERWDKNFLINGFVEVKNLISWPQNSSVSDTTVEFPDARSNSPDHFRHTTRILLNQHTIPTEKIALGRGELLFNILPQDSWQFLAVVEHQLVEISSNLEFSEIELGQDHRWTALQEVRLLAPSAFREFLTNIGEFQGLAPDGAIKPLEHLYAGYLSTNLREKLTGSTLFEVLETNTLIVEASAPFWINQAEVKNATPTTLQFLPNGSQTGILSQPEDYMDDESPLLLTMPFLGRLQPQLNDGLDTPYFLNELQVDPVFNIFYRISIGGGSLPSMSLDFGSWGDGSPITLNTSKLDRIYQRGWTRLDPLALVENWARLQNPLPEVVPATLQSVTSALPDTPARLSRSTALRHAFDAFRFFYPPALPSGYQLPPPVLDEHPVWREDSLLVTGAAGGITQPAPFGFAFTGLPIAQNNSSGTESNNRKYHAAATLIPANLGVARFPIRIQISDSDSLDQDNKLELSKLQTIFANNGLPLTKAAQISKAPATDVFSVKDDTLDQTYFVKVVKNELFVKPVGYPLSLTVSPYLGMGLRVAPDVTKPIFRLTPDEEAYGGFKEELISIPPDQRKKIGDSDYSTYTVGQVFDTKNAALSEDATIITELSEKRWRVTSSSNQLRITYHIVLESNEFKVYRAVSIPRLVSAELVCLDQTLKTLRPIASHTWEYPTPDLLLKTMPDGDKSALISQETILNSIQTWASETKRRLAPDSEIAVIRLRQINQLNTTGLTTSPEAFLTISYSFALVDNIPQIKPLAKRSHQIKPLAKRSHQIKPLAKRSYQLRASIEKLRFREGNFAGNQIPDTIKPFEIAPPQVATVQPFYEDKESRADWPWGMSSMRFETKYAKQGVIGTDPETNAESSTIWWQALGQRIQYRSALHTGQPAAGLPPLFRAKAIASLLPVPTNPKLPEPTNGNWQPVLPNNLNYLLLGSRPGAMLAVRQQLISQIIKRNNSTFRSLVSGSLPVQHRVPRPVPLPPNVDQETALQTWASYFEPTMNVLVESSPVDEAFFARCGNFEARRVKMKLAGPYRGLINTEWDGTLAFDFWFESESGQQNPDISDVSVEVLIGETAYMLKNNGPINWKIIEKNEVIKPTTASIRTVFEGVFPLPPVDADTGIIEIFEIAEGSKWKIVVDTDSYWWTVDKEKSTTIICPQQEQYRLSTTSGVSLKSLLLTRQPGDILIVKATVKDNADNGFKQVLTFPLHIGDEDVPRLPLEPRFIYFEDPEYNRLLATPSANATKVIKLKDNDSKEVLLVPLKLSTDRREYNPADDVSLRYDWAEGSGITSTASIEIKRIDEDGISTNLILSSEILDGIESSRLVQFSLSDLRKKIPDDTEGAGIQLTSGDVIELSLPGSAIAIKNTKTNLLDPEQLSVVLKLTIVSTPVTPPPKAGYALLRAQTIGGQQQVECRRFAWSPTPERIDLVCPDDLKTEVVRRRAVFKWSDAVRSNTSDEYKIQKINHNGSTHFPL